MSSEAREDVPAYAAPDAKAALLAAGVSGTIYSLVMPESEAALLSLVGDRDALLDRYREPWTEKQDAMHNAYFDRWIEWSSPIVRFEAAAFPFRYPTAGASEGIFKLMAEYAGQSLAEGAEPSVHIFEGEYEGYAAYAASLNLRCVRHERARWQEIIEEIDRGAMFWISQPSAIDGNVWPDFESFVALLAAKRPDVAVIPDLTYVGSIARDFTVTLDQSNIPAFVLSHSKPFGGYYHRVGGVFSRTEVSSLFGNKWFKNLLSLAWGTEMMRRHGVFDLPRKYREAQERAAAKIGASLGIGLEAADVMLIGTAPAEYAKTEFLRNTLRGSPGERRIRLCLTPTITDIIASSVAGESS